jgi:hypothetical protein
MQVRFPGGTNAGWRHIAAAAADWRCPSCSAYLRYYWLKCPSCNTQRPD